MVNVFNKINVEIIKIIIFVISFLKKCLFLFSVKINNRINLLIRGLWF